MNVATFPPPSLPAQLAELKRERQMRDRVYPHMIASRKIDVEKAAHNNRGLDGAIKTIETLVIAMGQPSRRELVDLLREALPLISLAGDGVDIRRKIHDALDRVRT